MAQAFSNTARPRSAEGCARWNPTRRSSIFFCNCSLTGVTPTVIAAKRSSNFDNFAAASCSFTARSVMICGEIFRSSTTANNASARCVSGDWQRQFDLPALRRFRHHSENSLARSGRVLVCEQECKLFAERRGLVRVGETGGGERNVFLRVQREERPRGDKMKIF